MDSRTRNIIQQHIRQIKLKQIIKELPLLLVRQSELTVLVLSSPSSSSISDKDQLTDLLIIPITVIILLWAQYTISISLVLNYLILTRGLALFGLTIWIPFNLFWSSTIINLARCVITGPGWVEKSPPNRRSSTATRDEYAQEDQQEDLERQPIQTPHHKIHHSRPTARQLAPYDDHSEEEDLEDDSDLESEHEYDHTSSVPLLSQTSSSTAPSRHLQQQPIPMKNSNSHRGRPDLLLPRPAVTSSSPPSYLSGPTSLPPSNLSFQEQVQRQQQSSSSPSDLLAALNFPPSVPRSSNRPEPSCRPDSLMCKSDGSLRFCRKCEHYKADRSHHCSSCGRCVLRMDHHCPWLGGRCVGLKNHKFFILFLLSSSITSIIAALAAGKGLMDFVSNTRISPGDPFQLAPLNWAFLLLVGGLFGMVLAGFTCYHLYLISVNRTTIENMERSVRIRPTGTRDPSESYALLRTTRLRAFEGAVGGTQRHRVDDQRMPSVPGESIQMIDGTGQETEEMGQAPKLPSYNLPIYKSDDQLSRLERRKLEAGATKLNLFDLGSTLENFKQIFGVHSPVWQWFLPIHPRGISDGYQFPINHHNLHKLVELTSEIRLLPNERSNELRFERP
ncbi:palmitoyltransferase for Vac8p [Puccinia graminis f. sp. tritici]|uniref:Palmitoyltransferase n=2 Tax=Puccinia graminis f. sp. tritici TaxID=56615 RepID=A0A5B0PD46_PUCGR|nr:palmitoyltransferase for Vac8p [Puccinia graminis f. sp. tritici]